MSKNSQECINEGFSVYKAARADRTALLQLYNKSESENIRNITQFLLIGDLFANLLREKEFFYPIFNESGNRFRQRHFNRSVSPEDIAALARDKCFSDSVIKIVFDPRLNRLQKALAFSFDSSALDAKAQFYLGINALKRQKPLVAANFFDRAQEKYYYRFDKDKALFWGYLATEDKTYLNRLTQSSDVNIYTIYAHNLLGKKLRNYTHLPSNPEAEVDFNYTDPFAWNETLKKIETMPKEQLQSYAKTFQSDATIGIQAFILERYHGYKKHFFPTPFLKQLRRTYGSNKLALLYAITRQESRFIPASISTSFALGQTQIMPFLIKAIAKEKKEKVELTQMFDPQKSIRYGLHQLRFLEKSLYHPLLIAYGYNGGIGFTKRRVLEQNMFEKRKYEPWLSMEMIPYTESRRYGKKVLANYIIYSKILNNEIDVKQLIATLTDKSATDRYRSK